jgi:predicted enzyme related to lactoylglutathione lyase
MNMAVGWFEIYVNDIEAATDFYQNVFDVTLEDVTDVPDEPSLTRSFPMSEQTDGANGALVKSDQIGPAAGGSIVYFEVDDCSVNEARVVAAGGNVIDAKKPIGPYGFMSLCRDTEGNIFGLHSMR